MKINIKFYLKLLEAICNRILKLLIKDRQKNLTTTIKAFIFIQKIDKALEEKLIRTIELLFIFNNKLL